MNQFNLTNKSLGRISSHIAKKLILKETVEVSNVEDVLITGSKRDIIAKYKHKLTLGTQRKGPFIIRTPRGLFERTVSRMIPKARRDVCMSRLVYSNVELPLEELFKNNPLNGLSLGDLCTFL